MLSPNLSPEERNEIARLSLRRILNLFPVAGPILTDILFEYRNNVKQDRLNHFVSLLEDAFIKHGITVEKLKSEKGLDLLERTIKKVTDTRSADKRIAFKNILLKGVTDPIKTDDCEIFNELLDSLKEEQLQILIEHRKYLSDGQPLLYKLQALNKQFRGNPTGETFIYTDLEMKLNREILNQNINDVKQLLEQYKQQCNASFFKLEPDQYHYYLRDLMAKGLLIDQGIGTYDPTPLQYMGITEFGLKFLDFIANE